MSLICPPPETMSQLTLCHCGFRQGAWQSFCYPMDMRLLRSLHSLAMTFLPLYPLRLCHNAEWSLRDASQASWQSRVFGYLGDCFSRCCSFAMTLRHSLPSKGGHEKSNSPEGDNLLCPPPAEVSRSDGGGRCNLPLYPLDKER
jgi:hypothetical protein